MKQALYRNWRPRSFKELVGQEHVTDTLEKALKSGRISHAYLFTGPRGVGKTSAARILAHAANQLPYEGEATHLDIIEIDAASNRRIDEIRDLRDKVAIAPTSGKYKVYIIDEVHMLTREAFNALLKTLEEPPAHTIFILATTEAHKLPETIVSRTQRFEFRPLPKAAMAKHLGKIAKNEQIDITPEALELLAEYGSGSFRDSISYLDQLSAAGTKITEEDARRILGLPPEKSVNKLVENVQRGDNAAIIDGLTDLKEAGVDAAAAAAAISKRIRQILISGSKDQVLMQLLKEMIDVPTSSRPYDYLEIALLEAGFQATESAASPPKKAEAQKSQPANIKAAVISAKKIKEVPVNITVFDESRWPDVVERSKQKAASLYTALRLAQPLMNEDTLVLRFQFPLHQKKLNQAKNKLVVAELIEELTGQKVNIECVVDKDVFKGRFVKAESEVAPTDNHIHSISNIFGAAEVVET